MSDINNGLFAYSPEIEKADSDAAAALDSEKGSLGQEAVSEQESGDGTLSDTARAAAARILSSPNVSLAAELGFSTHDINVLTAWSATLHSKSTRRMYLNTIIRICAFYKLPLHEIEPQMWVSYINVTMPKLVREHTLHLTIASMRTRYYAVSGLLDFYATAYRRKDCSAALECLTEPAASPKPVVSDFPSSSEIASILAYSEKYDIMTYAAVLLVYECALSVSEVLKIKREDFFHKEATDTYYLRVPVIRGQSRRTVEIRNDLMEKIRPFLKLSEAYADGHIIRSNTGSPMKRCAMETHIKKVCNELVKQGSLSEIYTLSSVRGAAFNRFLMSDGASVTSTAAYAGVHESYIYEIKKQALDSAVKLPGLKKGITIDDLLAAGKEKNSGSEKAKEELPKPS